MPDAIVFDLDGTLLDDDHALIQALQAFHGVYEEPLGLPFDVLHRRWTHLLRLYFQQYLDGALSIQEQRRRRVIELFRASGRTLSHPEADRAFSVYAAAYEQAWRLFDDAVPALRSLGHYRLAILTNGEPGQQSRKLRTTGLNDYFAAVCISGETGIAKPAPAAFHEVCRRLAVEPACALFVGDHLEIDARASTRAGLRGVWLNRNGAPGSFEGSVIRTLADLPALVSNTPSVA